MKNIVISVTPSRRRALTAATILTLGLGACNVTDVTPADAVSESLAYADASHVALSVTGVYDAAQSGYYNGNSPASGVRGYPFGAAANELGDVRGEDVADEAGFFAIVFQNSITTASPNITYMWANCYSVVNKANVAIAGIQQAQAAGVITAADEAVYEGELRFLRALAHLELTINWCRPYVDGNGSNPGIPYRTLANNTVANVTTSAAQTRGTVADDYKAMLADLDFAEANLPATRTGFTATRATKGAAIALKQRIRLYQGNWAQVIAEGNKLITGTTTFTSPIGSYRLMNTQREAFAGSPGITVTAENIFSIENGTQDNPGTNGALATVFGSSAAAPTGISARALLAVSPNLYNAPFFTCNDLRRTQMMQPDGGSRTAYVLKKYLDASTFTDYAPIIRYAEVLLNQAEAYARTGNDDTGLALLNAVRNRSVAVADQYAASSLMGTNLVRAILNERRIEFIGEGFRWGDISRLSPEAAYAPIANGGIPAKFNGQLSGQVVLAKYVCGAGATGQAVAAIAYSSPLFLWPIPSSETQTNANIVQNPGY